MDIGCTEGQLFFQRLVIGHLFWRDEENVDGGSAVHPEVSLGPVRLLEAVQHRGVHLLAVGARLKGGGDEAMLNMFYATLFSHHKLSHCQFINYPKTSYAPL